MPKPGNGGAIAPIEQSMLQRAIAGVRYALTGQIPANDWFGPGTPLPPLAQDKAVGRQFDFPVSINTRTRLRDTEGISFEQLRNLADNYDLLRVVIETRKDQMTALEWSVKMKDESKKPDTRCDRIQQFLAYPDQEHSWSSWLRMLLEDMLVIDAATIYPRMNKGGGLYGLELVDGGTIKRVLDQTGRTPMPPDVAFQQILKGLPAVDYSRDELIYAPRNPRTNRVYGYSPVEQIIMTVNIALRRQVHQLQYYTEGNVPEAIIGMPKEWNPDQIAQFQAYWDTMLEGDTASRRHAKFVPEGLIIHDSKKETLKDEYDEWLARVTCFAFSIEPTPFVKQANRATAQTARAQSLSEGLVPAMRWVEGLMNLVLAKNFGAPDLCFKFDAQDEVDAKTQAEIDQIYVTVQVKTPNEVRNHLGLDPLTPDQIQEFQALNPPPPPPPVPGDPAIDEGKPDAHKGEIHNHITVNPPDVLVDIGATTIHAQFDGDGTRKTETVVVNKALADL